MTPAPASCPECGVRLPADATRGVCPRCLLRRGLEAGPEDGDLQTANHTIHLVLPDDALLGEAPPARELGDYELLSEIGRGGMGVIYQARQRSLGRIVALKLIRAGTQARPEDIARFRTEASAAARLRHPHIVAIHEVGAHEGRHFYSMEFVPGRSLAATLREGPLAPRPAAECVRVVAAAIQAAHDAGVLHRDLKPSNILMDAAGEPHVADFGLAKLLHSDSELTVSGAVLGSPNYMPPEQARGKHAEVSTRSDVYALGAILYECLTGRPPFTAATPLETMKLVVEQEPMAPRRLNPALPRDLETICLKCLQKDPAHRYATAAALAEDLDRWLRHEPIRARPSGVWEHGIKWTRRHPARAGLVTLALLAPAVIIAVLLVMGAKLTRERDTAKRQERAAKASEATMRLNLYASDMFLTSRALEQGNLALARPTLAAHIPRAGEEDLRGFEWRHYWHLAQGQQERVLGGFSNAVNSVAYSPDGRWLAAGSGNLVRKWDATNFALAATFRHDAKAVVNSVAFSADGSTLWAGDQKGQVRVWLDGLARPLVEFSRGTGYVHLALSAGAAGPIAIGERDGTEGGAHGAVALYGATDLLTRNERGNMLTNSGGLAAFSRDGQWLLTGGEPSGVTLHNLKTGDLQPLEHHAGLFSLALAPDGTRAATSAYNGFGPALYDFRPGKTFCANLSLGVRIRALAFSPDGGTLAVACFDHTIRLLDSALGVQIHRFDGHTDQVLAVAFSPDGRTLASAGKDGTVRLWDSTAGSRDTLKQIYLPFTFSPDQRTIFAANDENPVSFMRHDLTAPERPLEPVLTLRWEQFPKSLSRDDYSSHGGLLRWLLHGGASPQQLTKFEQFLAGHTNLIASASAADGSVVALLDKDGRVRLWHDFTSARLPDLRPPDGMSLRQLKLAGGLYPQRFVLSDDGHALAMVTGKNNVASIWHTATGTNLLRLPPRADFVTALVFSPDGRTLAVAGDDTTVQLRDARTGDLQATLAGHDGAVVAIAFSPDGRTLATQSGNGGVKLWHTPTWREVGTLAHSCSYLTFSPEGTLLLLVDWNGNARLLRAPHPLDAAPLP